MANNFDFVSAGRIVFGAGRAPEAGAIAKGFGRRCLLVRGKSAGAGRVADSLRGAGLDVVEINGPPGEPDETDVDAAVPIARDARPDVVVAVGGGSVLDFAKAVAALVPQTENAPVHDYLEGVGRGLTIMADPIPLIACPTTAGTGAEVTKNAVISSRASRFKKSLRDARMVPKVALVDPDLQAGAPHDVRVWSGLDALTQNVEAYLSVRATPLTDLFAERGLHAAAAGLVLLTEGDEAGAQEPLALAALLSGLALANGGLGAAHGIAQALGVYGVPHGLACAVALPWVVSSSYGDKRARRRLYAVANQVGVPTGRREVVRWLWWLNSKFAVPRLAELKSRYPDLPALDEVGLDELAVGARGNSLSGNPVPMSDADVADLLRRMRDADAPAEAVNRP
jgi:alcohol dehydrogenase class IV